jgi:hypothetical protein
MKFNLLFLFILIVNSSICLAHIEIFNFSDGKLSGYSLWEKSYAFTIQVTGNQNVFIEEIGIDFFNVGDDGDSEITLGIYEENKANPFYLNKFQISEIYNQIALIQINKLLSANKKYQFIFKNDLNNPINLDNQINLFTPNSLPTTEKTNLITTLNSGEIGNTSNLECPFIHFSISSQTSINIGVNSNNIQTQTNNYSKSIVFEPSKKLHVKKIGLDNLFLKSGNNNILVSIQEINSNNIITEIDTLISSFETNKLWIENDIYLDPLQGYKLKVEIKLNQDDSLFLFKTNSIPFYENLNTLKIYNESNTNSEMDSLFPFLLIDFEEYTEPLSIEKVDINQLAIKLSNNFLRIPFSKTLYNIELYDILGNKIEKNTEETNYTFQIEHNKLYILSVNNSVIHKLYFHENQ